MVAFELVSEKQQHPSTEEKSHAPNPLHQEKKNDACKNHGDSDAMQQFVRSGFVLVIVLRHVVRQARHVAHLLSAVPGCQVAGVETTSTSKVDFIPNCVNFLERSGTTESIEAADLLRRQTCGGIERASLGTGRLLRRPPYHEYRIYDRALSRPNQDLGLGKVDADLSLETFQ